MLLLMSLLVFMFCWQFVGIVFHHITFIKKIMLIIEYNKPYNMMIDDNTGFLPTVFFPLFHLPV